MQKPATHRSVDPSGNRSAALPPSLQRWEKQVIKEAEISEAVYDRARKRFVAATVDHPAVVAVYGDSASPTVPGISDLDLTLVVKDRIDQLSELQESVVSVCDDFSAVFSHSPIILPESVFERLPLIANNTTSFDHLAGRSFTLNEPDEVVLTLRFFDRLAYKPYGYLTSDLCPVWDGPLQSRVPEPIAVPIERTIQPMVAAASDHRPSADRLQIKKTRILSKVASLQYDRDLFEHAIGAPPDVDGELLERVKRYRQRHAEEPVTAEECLELLFDGLSYSHQLYREFIDRQTIYPASDRIFYLRRNVPTVATPAWNELSAEKLLDCFYESGINGRVLPPEAALHAATLPKSDDLFYGTAPDPEPSATVAIEQRTETIQQYLKFVESHRHHEGFSDTFKLVHTGEFIQQATGGTHSHSSVSGLIGTHARELRNRFIAKRWY